MTLTATLARFVATADPPPNVTPTVACAVADCFGCILAGANTDIVDRLLTALSPHTSGEAPLFGSGRTLSPAYAAMANATAGHVHELDDWEELGNTHPTVVLLPALLANASMRTSTGRQLLDAYAVGFEVIARLGEAMTLEHYVRGFHSTATLGAIGAAAAISRLRSLDAKKTGHALALAVSQATGLTAQFGSDAKPLHAGFAARTGLEAGLMAEAGITAQVMALEGPKGFASLKGNATAGSMKAAISKLGMPWAIEECGIIMKPWPSCAYTHRLMTAAQELRAKLLERPSAIVSIAATQPDFHLDLLPFHIPRTQAEALFSAPGCIAQMLAVGTLTLADIEDRFWEKPEVGSLMPLVSVTPEAPLNPELNYDPAQPDRLTVTLASGEALRAECAYPLGSPQYPMTQAQLGEKYASVTGRDSRQFFALLEWPDAQDIAAFFDRFGA